MTPVAFTLTRADMVAGNQLAFRRYVRKGMPKFVLFLVVLSLAVSIFAFAMASRPLIDALLLFAKILGFYTALGAMIVAFILIVMPKQRAKKNFSQMPALSREQIVSWDDASIAFTSGSSNAIIALAELYQWAADDGIIILYPADHLFYMLPARVFVTAEDRSKLTAALETHGVKRL